MRPMTILWAAAIAIVGGLLLWRNRTRYRRKSWLFVAGKSLFEVTILFVTVSVMPALLIVWLVCWVTRPIQTPWIKAVVGILAGISFGFLSSFALEALVFFGIFAVDGKTGSGDKSGFLNCYKRAQESQRPHLVAA